MKWRQVLEVNDGEGNLIQFLVRLNEDRTEFMLKVKANEPMGYADVTSLVSLFAKESEISPKSLTKKQIEFDC